ncbi:MAG: hypothetical protein KDE04_05165 [Anaerolineales bacterium]|nr:hypothetical protein [Anaerolineales bacterium]MCB0026889.1 hypothetical protein [Anaerolineales bacterium]
MQQLAEGIYAEINYEGVNVGAIMTPRGIICIDAPSYPRDARHWAMRLRQINAAPVQYLIILDDNGDRLLNTRWLNAKIVTHDVTRATLLGYEKRYPQGLLDSLAQRNPLAGKELSSSPVDRPDVTFSHRLSILKHLYEIDLIHAPGPSAGSIWAHLPRQGILFMGDSLTIGEMPPLLNADLDAWLDSLDYLQNELNDVQLIVPGRGPLGDMSHVEAMRCALTQVQEKLSAFTKGGATAQETVDAISAIYGASQPYHEWHRQQLQQLLDRRAAQAKSEAKEARDAAVES